MWLKNNVMKCIYIYIEWGKRIDDFKTSRLMETMRS